MAWPTGSIDVTNMDQGTDDPSQARANIKNMAEKINLMIPARATADGVASLDGTGVIPASQLAKALLLAGGTMTGFIVLHADPTANLHPASKQYVDNSVAAAQPFASGTVMLFRQTAAPTGWTKDTSFNEHALRVTTGTVGSGGTDNFTTVFGTGKTTGSHTLTTGEIPSHTHTTDSQGAHTHTVGYGDGVTGGGLTLPTGVLNKAITTNHTSSNNGAHTHTAQATGGGGSHNHTLSNLNVKYCDIILASKN